MADYTIHTVVYNVYRTAGWGGAFPQLVMKYITFLYFFANPRAAFHVATFCLVRFYGSFCFSRKLKEAILTRSRLEKTPGVEQRNSRQLDAEK